MFDIQNDSAWLSASKIIEEKYGKILSYRSLRVLNPSLKTDEPNNFFAKGEDLVIPLKEKSYDLGDVIVFRGAYLDPQQKAEVADLVGFLIKPSLYNIHLKKKENGLSLNVTHEDTDVIELFNSNPPAKQTLSQLILLKSQLELSRNKVALKIHEMTERNLFVHLADIIQSISKPEDFKSLSDVTIYINDIEKLSAQTLSMLNTYLSSHWQNNGPLFLIGSTLTMEQIENSSWPNSLKKDLLGFYFDIDRVPLSQQTSEEILDLLFFKFDTVLS